MFEPLEHWREFFLLVGTAAAALVALLFVAASVAVGYLTPERASATRTYMSPVVVHFTAVVVACALGLVPSHTGISFGLLLAASALGAGAYSTMILLKVLKRGTVDWADKFDYGIAPVIGYAAALVAAGMFFAGAHRAPEVLAGAIMLLLIVNIRNAWDLMLFFATKQLDSS
jgi:hypothetical protein